ncbi:methyl-accepting chemotaxis protein [Phenylobacterium sp.]|jgi:methyl-accepting chemotaxis protein|uniref:methyl-accepting chemotaxis protein n=1 Tax=Phenylobacterium sp. TaxID=1871053 RepID=UPI004037109D
MSNHALADRLTFMRLGPDAQNALRASQETILRALPEALDSFYEQVRATPETRAFFSDESHISSARSRQIGHWQAIAGGRFDSDFMAAVTKVGETHARIGLEPRWYIGGYALLLEHLLGELIEAHWPKGGLLSRARSAEGLKAQAGAIAKAVMLDMDLAISVYLEAAEAARQKAEAEVLRVERARVVKTVGEAMAALSRGDLTHDMPDDMPEEYSQLRADYQAAVDSLGGALQAIRAATDTMAGGAEEITSASHDLSRRTEQQAASLTETVATVGQIVAAVRQSADNAKQAAEAASTARSDAERSGEIMGQAISAMQRIETSSTQIGQIIGVIDEIAFQTNLLALNAGVEAARAGDAGRGFAVVAQEVRALAQRSAEAAKEIKGLIAGSSSEVEHGARLVKDTGAALHSIVERVGHIDGLIAGIASAARDQSENLDQVNGMVGQMDQTTQHNAAMAEESNAAAASLQSQSKELSRLVAYFRILEQTGRAGRALSSGSDARRLQSHLALAVAR